MVDTRFYTPLGPVRLADLVNGLNVEPLEIAFQDELIHSGTGLGQSEVGQISFLGGKKYAAQIETAGATACFVSEELGGQVGQANIIPIISKFPRAHFGRIVARLVRLKTLRETGQLDPAVYNDHIHPTAIISATAKLAENVEVGPYAIIGPGVEIGAGTRIGSHAVIDCSVIGAHCIIKPHAALGGQGFGVDSDENGVIDLPHIGRLFVGNRVSIGSHTTVDRGYLADTILGDDVKVDNQVQIAHNVVVGSGSRMAAHVGISGSCTIGKNVMMGGNVGLADHISVGDGAVLAARAGVMHNVPAGEMWSGIPAMPIRDHMRIVAATRKLIKKKT